MWYSFFITLDIIITKILLTYLESFIIIIQCWRSSILFSPASVSSSFFVKKAKLPAPGIRFYQFIVPAPARLTLIRPGSQIMWAVFSFLQAPSRKALRFKYSGSLYFFTANTPAHLKRPGSGSSTLHNITIYCKCTYIYLDLLIAGKYLAISHTRSNVIPMIIEYALLC